MERTSRRFWFHGFPLELAWSDVRLGQAASYVTECVGGATLTSASIAPAFRLDLDVTERLPSVPPDGVKYVEMEYDISLWAAEGAIYLRHEHGTVKVSIDSGVGQASFLPQAVTNPREAFLLITLSLALLLRRAELYALHAAGVSNPDGEGYLFVGPSGSGKSTLTFGLGRLGWGYLSDDSLVLRLDEGSVEVEPFRRDFCLSPSLAEMFDELNEERWARPTFDENKWRVDVEELFDSPRLESCRPSVLVFPSITSESTSRIGRMNKKEALLRLLPQSGLILDRDSKRASRHLNALRILADQTSAYQLELGGDVLRDPAILMDILP